MARSRGQLRKRGRNKYLVRIYLGRVDGKRKYKSKVVHGTEKEAEKVLTKMLRKKDRGIRVSPSSEKLDEFLDAWLDTKRGKIAASTLKFYKNNIRIHIKPGLGHLKLESLTPRIVQEFIDELCTKELSAAYIQKIQGTLRTALNQAVNWELIPYNPASGQRLSLPTKRKREYRILSKEDIRKFLEATHGTRLYAMWVLWLATGLRPQEIVALKWDDLGEDGFLQVRRVVKLMDPDKRDYRISEEMKTEESRREIKLPDSVLGVLERHRAEQAKEILAAGDTYERQGFIFANESGKWTDTQVVRDAFNDALTDASLPDEIRLYDLRHTHISHLIIDGVDLKKASSRAGHSSIKLTADTYTHLDRKAEEEMAEVSARMFADASN